MGGPAAGGDPAVIRRFVPGTTTGGFPGLQGTGGAGPAAFTTDDLRVMLADRELLDELADRLVERVERRVREDIERRGLRGYPGVF